MNNNLNYCAPKSINNVVTCFNIESLIKITKQYNKKYPNDIIKIPNKINKKTFWKKLISKINSKTNCNNELCLLNQDFVKTIDNIQNEFRPIKPNHWKNNQNAWLSTTDIDKVLEQYEKRHIDFKYIGAVPIDFDKKIMLDMCIVDELCKINIKKLYLKGIRKLGVVFNLDPHNKPGIHWVSLFIDFNNGGIYYFDSYGKPPVNEICNFMEKIRTQGNKMIESNLILLNNEHDEKHTIHHLNKENNVLYIKNKEHRLKLDTPIYLGNTQMTDLDNIYKITNIKKIDNIIKLTLNKKIKHNDLKYTYLIQRGFFKFYNNIRFQYGGSECGVYSIYFQTQLLNGIKFKDVIRNIMDDNTINKKRNYYYRPIHT